MTSSDMRTGLFRAALIMCCVAAGIGQEECSTIQITTDASLWPFSGIYKAAPQGLSSTQVYRHTCHGMYLFYHPSPPTWFMGPDPNRAAGLAYSRTEVSQPDEITGGWVQWDKDEKKFVDLGDVNVLCTADEGCDHLATGASLPKGLTGVYSKTGQIQSSRPIYKHRDKALFLYHQRSGPGCQRWMIGPESGSTKAAVYVSSAAYLPPSQPTEWTLSSPDGGVKLQGIELTCTSENASIPDQPSDPIPEINKDCGLRKADGSQIPSALIYNGIDVSYLGKWPSTVSILKQDGTHKCAGGLFGSRWVVTAGHCVASYHPWMFYTVVLGTTNIDKTEVGTLKRKIKEVYRHVNFYWTQNPFAMSHDIAVLELDRDVPYSDFIQPACLPSAQEPILPGQFDQYSDCWMVGWGITSQQDGTSGGLLQEQKVTLGDIKSCITQFTPDLSWGAHTQAFCIYPENGAKICKGDSGSPVFCQKDGLWTIVGVASWTLIDCRTLNIPSVYTDIAQFRDWMGEVLPSQ